MSSGDKIGCLWMIQPLLFGLKKGSLAVLIGKWSTILGCKGDCNALVKLCNEELLKIGIFSFRFTLYLSDDVHSLLWSWYFLLCDRWCFVLQFSYRSVVVSLEWELYLYLSVSSPVSYTIIRLNLNVIPNLRFHKRVI